MVLFVMEEQLFITKLLLLEWNPLCFMRCGLQQVEGYLKVFEQGCIGYF